MNILPLTQWIRNAAAALSFSFGSVSEQARHAGCSRQTVYQHAHKVLSALELQQQGCPLCQQLLLENQRLRRDLQDAQQRLDQAIDLGPPRQLQLAILLCALGVSINQTLEVLLLLLTKAACPGRSTICRWLCKAGQDAGQVLTVLDSQTQPAVCVLEPDEIFFHGQPTLVAVELASQALLLCQRAANRTGATWAAALQPFVNLEVVVSDAGTASRDEPGFAGPETPVLEHAGAEIGASQRKEPISTSGRAVAQRQLLDVATGRSGETGATSVNRSGCGVRRCRNPTGQPGVVGSPCRVPTRSQKFTKCH